MLIHPTHFYQNIFSFHEIFIFSFIFIWISLKESWTLGQISITSANRQKKPYLQCPCQKTPPPLPRIRITDQDQANTFANSRIFLDHTDLVCQYHSLYTQAGPAITAKLSEDPLVKDLFSKIAASTKFSGKCIVSCSCCSSSLRKHKV